MRLRFAILAASLLLPSSALAASQPEVISKPRDRISDLFLTTDDLAWNWRDDGRAGSSLREPGTGERTRPAGLVPDPSGAFASRERTAAYSSGGRLLVVRNGRREVVATNRRGVGAERFTASTFRQALIWSERGRGLYGSAAASPEQRSNDFSAFTKPRRLAEGRIRATALKSGTGAAVSWQDGRNRIRARVIKGKRFGPAVTLAKADGPVSDLQVFTPNTVRLLVVWSTRSGVRVSVRNGPGQPFSKPVELSTRPARGIAAVPNNQVVGFGQPGGVRFFSPCRGKVATTFRSIPGRPHLDQLDRYPEAIGYTLGGEVRYGDEVIGTGRDLRAGAINDADGNGELTQDFFWLRGVKVLKRTFAGPFTRGLRGGVGQPTPCDDV